VWRLVDHWAPLVANVGGTGGTGKTDELAEGERAVRRKTHDTIRRVTVDIEERMHLNTAVSSLMELVNELYAFSDTTPHGQPSKHAPVASGSNSLRLQTLAVVREALDGLVLMVSPFAPHMAEELWQMLGHDGGLARATWPVYDADVAKAQEVVVPVQINGKVRARVTVPAELPDGELQDLVLADAVVRSHIAEKTIRKIVVAKGPLVSIVL
jgi:leucyl-tRNA synthetase